MFSERTIVRRVNKLAALGREKEEHEEEKTKARIRRQEDEDKNTKKE